MKNRLILILFCLIIIGCVNNIKTEQNKGGAFIVDSIITKTIDKPKIAIEDKMIGNLPDTLELPGYVNIALTSIPDSLRVKYDKILLGDFNADNRQDFASLVINNKTKEIGVIIIHDDDKNSFIVFGAEKEI